MGVISSIISHVIAPSASMTTWLRARFMVVVMMMFSSSSSPKSRLNSNIRLRPSVSTTCETVNRVQPYGHGSNRVGQQIAVFLKETLARVDHGPCIVVDGKRRATLNHAEACVCGQVRLELFHERVVGSYDSER